MEIVTLKDGIPQDGNMYYFSKEGRAGFVLEKSKYEVILEQWGFNFYGLMKDGGSLNIVDMQSWNFSCERYQSSWFKGGGYLKMQQSGMVSLSEGAMSVAVSESKYDSGKNSMAEVFSFLLTNRVWIYISARWVFVGLSVYRKCWQGVSVRKVDGVTELKKVVDNNNSVGEVVVVVLGYTEQVGEKREADLFFFFVRQMMKLYGVSYGGSAIGAELVEKSSSNGLRYIVCKGYSKASSEFEVDMFVSSSEQCWREVCKQPVFSSVLVEFSVFTVQGEKSSMWSSNSSGGVGCDVLRLLWGLEFFFLLLLRSSNKQRKKMFLGPFLIEKCSIFKK